MSNRREFVVSVAASFMLGGLAPVSVAVAGGTRNPGRLSDGLSEATFEALVGQNFYVYESVRGVSNLRLIAVRERASKSKLEQFSLVFRGSEVEQLQGGIYRLEHPTAGAFDLRIDLTGRDTYGLLYRSDVSLLI